jgi:hypothetical protein
MNEHKKINELLTEFILGKLSIEQAAEVRTHIEKCSECSDEIKRLEALLEQAEHIRKSSVDKQTCESAKQAILRIVEQEKTKQQISGVDIHPEFIWRTIMNSRTVKLAAAVVIVIVVLGGITFWPDHNSQNGQWWLGPPAAWGQEIMAGLDKIEALVYRKQSVFVSQYGSTHVSGTWSRYYEAANKSRKERYYENTDEDTFGDSNPDSILQDVTYSIPDGNDLIIYDISFEYKCYTIRELQGGAYEHDPVERLRFYVGLLDKADRILDKEVFDGRECIGFEIDISKYGDNPAGQTDRIWLDVVTKLPVRIENHGWPVTDRPGTTMTNIQDQFEYYAQVPVEMFEPEIPDGFINAEPSDIHKANIEQEKGQMIYADVPPEVTEAVATAMKSVGNTVFRERFGFVKDGNWVFSEPDRIYISRYDWRKDYYSGGNLQQTEWFFTNKSDWGQTSLDFNDRNFKLIQTVVNYPRRSYREITHGSTSHPNNPMDRIIFLIGWIGKADVFFDSETIENTKCFGFELSAKKYGTNPDTSIHHLWFDAETNLPVKLEFEWLQDDGPRKIVQDQFEWNVELPAETFIPEIPDDYTLETPSDG